MICKTQVALGWTSNDSPGVPPSTGDAPEAEIATWVMFVVFETDLEHDYDLDARRSSFPWIWLAGIVIVAGALGDGQIVGIMILSSSTSVLFAFDVEHLCQLFQLSLMFASTTEL